MNPQTVIAYVKRATARREQSKIVLAMADVEEAKKLDPELALALLRRAGEYQANIPIRQGAGRLQRSDPARPDNRCIRRTQRQLYYFKAIWTRPWPTATSTSGSTRIRVGLFCAGRDLPSERRLGQGVG